ncbi:MAG: LysR family transcriptional regulator [Erysipelotrichaceae bacterium]|nr:LysR family transcriptional regulator [Erysipelotrichaceae bacterium]
MNFHSLYFFKKVAELQHLTKAAEKLFISQPSLSRSISSLEDELGVKLFDRVGKSIVLNDYGRIVLQHAENIFKEEEAIHSEIADFKKEGSKTVHLSMRAGTQHLAELLYGFARLYPNIKVSTLQGYIEKEDFEKMDLRIIARNQKETNPHEFLLYSERIMVALPADHPLAFHKTINISELKDQHFVSLKKGNALRDLLDQYCLNAGFEPNIFIECNSAETVRKMLRLGGNISLVPELSWGGISTDNTVLRPLSSPQGTRYLYLIENKPYLSESAKCFRDYTLQYFRDIVENGPNAYISGHFQKKKKTDKTV